jgi:hypothetical protein
MTTKFFSATVLMLLSASVAFGDIKLKKMVGRSVALLDPHWEIASLRFWLASSRTPEAGATVRKELPTHAERSRHQGEMCQIRPLH